MYEKEILLVDKAVMLGYRDQDSANAWHTLKSAVLAQQSTNSAMVPCPKCGGNVWTELVQCSNCEYEFNHRIAYNPNKK